MTPRTPRCLAVLALAAAAAFPLSAHADPVPRGRPCDFFTVSSQPLTGDEHVGEIYGGPVVALGSAVSIRCSIHLGNAVHSGPAAAVATAGPRDHAVVLTPTRIAFPEMDAVATCTEARVDATTWYWTGDEWTTDADARCVENRSARIPGDLLPPPPGDLPPPLDQVVGYAWCLVAGDFCDGLFPVADAVACPVLAALSPGVPGVVDIAADGDVAVAGEAFWDCAPA